MKKTFKAFIFFIFLVLNLCSCSALFRDPSIEWNSYTAYTGHIRNFYGYQYDSNGNRTDTVFNAKCVLITEYLEVYLEETGITGDQDTITNITSMAEYYAKYYSKITEIYGDISDVDNNGKLIILICNIQPKSPGSSYIAGYFNAMDLIKTSGSNGSEIIYINKSQLKNRPFLPGDLVKIMDTVFHELQHAINYNRRVKTGKTSDIWIDEGLSESTYFVHMNNVNDGRLASYNSDIDNVKIGNGEYFYKWENNIANYATVSLFMYWLYMQSGNPYIFKDIAHCTGHQNFEPVVEAAKKRIDSSLYSWDILFSTWLEANHKNEPRGLYGYQTNLGIKTHIGTGDIYLKPGGAVYTTETLSPDEFPAPLKYKSLGSGVTVVYNPTIFIPAPPVKISLKVPGSPRAERSVNTFRQHNEPVPIDICIREK